MYLSILHFHDRETGRIDSLIEKKERQIELLQEKRAALISHAVTKGLDPDVKMKDSGVEWLGEVPEHWNIYRSKLLFQEANDRSTTGEETLLTVSHITGVTRRSEKNVTMFMAESLEGYKKCEAGDLVINTMWAWMGAMGIAPERGIVSPSYNVYSFRSEENEPSFYNYLFRIGQFSAEVICHSKGVWSSRLRLYPEEFFEIRIPCPSQKEQRMIVSFIQKETGNYEIPHSPHLCRSNRKNRCKGGFGFMTREFRPKFVITNRITSALTMIERARGFLEAAELSEEWIRSMGDRALVLEAHHTTHIEGTQLTLDQARRLLAGEDVSNVDPNDVRELLNYRRAFDFVSEYLDSGEYITGELILEIHRRLVEGVRGGNSATGEVIYRPPPPEEVSAMMETLVEWLNSEKETHPVLVSGIAQFPLNALPLSGWLRL